MLKQIFQRIRLKSWVPKLHMKLVLLFPFIANKTKPISLTKRDIFIGFLFSPFSMLTIFNIFYFCKALHYYFSYSFNYPYLYNLIVFSPLISFSIAMIFGIFKMKQKKSFFMMFVNNNLFMLLNIAFFIMFIVFLLHPMHIFSTFILFIYNLILILLTPICFLKSKDTTIDFFNNNKFKLVFLTTDFNRIIIFYDNFKILYHEHYILFDKYKMTYQEVSLFEKHFNKPFYDFDEQEFNVIHMYIIQ